jgi:Zn finger protein HypA/HybF involved in hydrogenase expression
MHEHHFIQKIIEPIENKENVTALELEVGDLVGILPDHLKEHLVDETGWNVIIFKKPSKVKCSCGYLGEANILQRLHDLVIFDCPKCGGEPEVFEGKDIKILKVGYRD